MVLRGIPDGTQPRAMRRDDLDFVVSQHSSHFPTNVVGRFGGGLLRRYYVSFLDGPEAVAFVVQQGPQRLGYLVGILDTTAHRRHVRRHHGRALAGHAAFAFFRHPRLASELLLHRLRLRRSRRAAQVSADNSPASNTGEIEPGAEKPTAVLSHVAVHDGARGAGLGRALVDEFAQRARVHGAGVICLATLDGPSGAGSFYDALGWQLTTRRRTFDGRDILLYELPLPPQEGDIA